MPPDSPLWPIVLLTLKVSGLAVLISSVVGVPLGAWLGMASPRLRSIVRPIVFTAMALPPVVVGLVLYMLLSRSGPLGALGWLFTPQAMIAAQVILAFPFVVGITMTAVASVPTELVLQLHSLGASSRQARWAMVREARSGVALAIAAAFGRSISEVGAVLIVGGNILSHTRVLTTAIVLETRKGHFEFALLLGGMLLLLAVIINILILRLHKGQPAT